MKISKIFRGGLCYGGFFVL